MAGLVSGLGVPGVVDAYYDLVKTEIPEATKLAKSIGTISDAAKNRDKLSEKIARMKSKL